MFMPAHLPPTPSLSPPSLILTRKGENNNIKQLQLSKITEYSAAITSQDEIPRSALRHSDRGWCERMNARWVMEATLAEHEPAVRRLCIATASGAAGLLAETQRSERLYRLYLMSDPADGIELAFAAPGLDETLLVSDLIVAIQRQAAMTAGLPRPVVAGFHVGMTRVIGDGIGGAGAERIRALVQDPAIRMASERVETPAVLAVAVTSGFFEELRAEGLSGQDWQSVPDAGAWLKLFDAA